MTQTAVSPDGTSTTFDVFGDGLVLILLGGAFNIRLSPHPLVDLLAAQFTVYSPDRRERSVGPSRPRKPGRHHPEQHASHR